MEKQDTSRRDTNAKIQSPAVSGFGKVLGSIQGLRQRLGEFSLEDISAAEANVRSLVKQLIVMRDNLADLAQLKHAVIESNRRIDDIAELNFDLISLDSLEKHPQLHAIVQASKLMRFHRLMKAAQASADTATFDNKSNEFRVRESTAAQDRPAQSRDETVAAIDEPEITFEQKSTDDDAQTLTVDPDTMDTVDTRVKDTAIANATPPPELKATLTVKREQSSPATPIPADFSLPVDQDDNQPTDWSFDLGEVSSTVSGSASASVDFVFPDESFSDRKPAPRDASTIILAPPAVAPVAAPASIAAASPQPAESRELLVSKDNLEITTASAPAKAAPDGAKATTEDPDIDQRLLDELIKNYGDFSATRNLPATLEASKPAEPQYDNPAVETSTLFDEPITPERQRSNLKKAGDLDRQLKKIIKDYGENDLYPRQSLVNLKTGGIAAFAVLGLVLGALYLFKAPNAAGPTQARPAPPSAEIQKAASMQAAGKNNSSASKVQLAGPEAANASTDPLTESEQKP